MKKESEFSKYLDSILTDQQKEYLDNDQPYMDEVINEMLTEQLNKRITA